VLSCAENGDKGFRGIHNLDRAKRQLALKVRESFTGQWEKQFGYEEYGKCLNSYGCSQGCYAPLLRALAV
jgi:hypothetical protein